MKHLQVLIIIFFFIETNILAQVGIGNSEPDASSALDITSTTGGLLPPRMTTSSRDAIDSPATGLIVFNTTDNILQINEGTASTPNWVNLSTTIYSIGDFAHGGIVFWIDETGQHGLVCAKEDQNNGALVRWYAGTNGNTMAYGAGPLSGKLNTSFIISTHGYGDGSTYAARICNEIQIAEGGIIYGDWYLPSKYELNLMYQIKTTINTTALANNGSEFSSYWYWSSSEFSSNNAWGQKFSDGRQANGSKNTDVGVRAVRSF